MRILSTSKNLISFSAISLNQEEKEKADTLISQFQMSKNKDKLKYDLLEIFDSHIQKDSVDKSKGIYYIEDFLQTMYLNFFEAIENIKELSTQRLVDILNSINPDKNELKEEYRRDMLSLATQVAKDRNLTIQDRITSDGLPVFQKFPSDEERKIYFDKIQKLVRKIDLSDKEKKWLEEKSRGKTFKQIAKEAKKSQTFVQKILHNAVAKIQDSQGILPEEFNDFIEQLILKYNLDIPKDKIKNILLNNISLLSYQQEKVFQNIDRTANSLDIEPKDFAIAILKQPSLFYQKTDTIMENINKTATLLKIDSASYIQAALKQPSLFYQKPETILENISRISNLLKIDPKNYIQLVLKQPQLFSLKPETILKKVRIIQYYKQIQHKNSDKIVLSTLSESSLYQQILSYLVKKEDGLKSAISKKEFIDYLRVGNKTYNFEIQENELAQEFIRFAKAFSEKHLGKQIFQFKIKI